MLDVAIMRPPSRLQHLSSLNSPATQLSRKSGTSGQLRRARPDLRPSRSFPSSITDHRAPGDLFTRKYLRLELGVRQLRLRCTRSALLVWRKVERSIHHNRDIDVGAPHVRHPTSGLAHALRVLPLGLELFLMSGMAA
ncbi:hypothetical protein C8Q76DRAFT_398516 [Earliella scabrosa]|nr:hypothetical protein C8Q76DRAFT_398516 [Earliella scabrosa]